ncbi:tRNA 2-thiouridine(34) synthase MnmA [Collinsella sp. An271]|uniref:tRNA 2-thiouridine(34) synthase MnmA n=1 Tax=Collinsella sp. An271 TaxID=1965616 RepID=UPI0019522C71|nr:tRNA 2-thiouridine(34) synthase MnmA [Collinsella sp. An271]
MPSKGRVLVAMSGGVDSSVTAYLLKQQGYECVGVTMRLTCSATFDDMGERSCCSLSDLEDAEAVAQRLGIPYRVVDMRDIFERDVVAKFVSTYEAGRTPNPCIDCNRYLKFGALLDYASSLDCSHIATGHYARVRRAPTDAGAPGPWTLSRAADAGKDQSYVLYSLTQERLAHVLLPLGNLIKDADVRRIAAEQGFASASKPDSQGICFVPDNDFASFIEAREGRLLPEGDIVSTSGEVLGRHRGALRYTIGQRKGLGVAAAHPLYVCGIDVESNTVTLGGVDDLMADELDAGDWIWSAPAETIERRIVDAGAHGLPVAAKIRYHQPDQPARVRLVDAEAGAQAGVHIDFDIPQRGIAPGQAVVIYDGEVVLGGGTVL